MSPEKAPRAPRTRARIVRWAVLASVLAAITVIGYLHQTAGTGRPAGVDALCPFGGLETAYALVTSGFLLKRVAISGVILLVAALAVAVVFRRSFCGQICPLGFLQEMFGGLGRRVFKKRPVMPTWLDRPARYLKYVVLVVFIGLAWTTADLAIRPYDPWVAYMHLTSAEVFAEFSIGFAVLVAAVVGSFVYDRFFCKYLCPMGATLGLISKFSIFKVRRTTTTCIDCKACDIACPVNINVSEAETVNSPECINCNECVTACPVKDTLAMSTSGGKRLSALGTTVAVVAVFAIIVGGATVAGSFEWRTPSLAQEAGAGRGNGAGSEGADGDTALIGDFDVSLIKGRTTLTEVSEVTGIPASMFQRVLGVPESEQGLPLKDTKGTYGFSPEDVRTMVELYRVDPAAAEAYIPLGSSEE
ncbi:MAG: 4Fe-4S ferredoxin [Actinobacteria bacterium HGW-Actinobacteria-6]|nr:MAG: 4Fe-4S ferredoxin [Actinobacteria bacterium HGW-Actinobacteria-6]